MGDYSQICEFRGRTPEGTGCSKIQGEMVYCAKHNSPLTTTGNCLTLDLDTLVDSETVDYPRVDFPLGVIPANVTFTRNSIATYYDIAGTMQVAPINTPRWDYDPFTHAYLGLFIEHQAYNDVWWANDLTKSWIDGGDTSVYQMQRSQCTPTGPNILLEDASAGEINFPSLQMEEGAVPGTIYWHSLEVTLYDGPSAGMRWLGLRIQRFANDFPPALQVVFDVVAGTVTATSGDVVLPTVKRTSANRVRCSVGLPIKFPFTYPDSHTDWYILTSPNLPLNNTAIRDLTSGFYLYNIQSEIGPKTSSFIPTAAKFGLTRQADNATINWSMDSRFAGDGAYVVRYGAVDGSFQDYPTYVSGGKTIIPTNLTNQHIVSAELRLPVV